MNVRVALVENDNDLRMSVKTLLEKSSWLRVIARRKPDVELISDNLGISLDGIRFHIRSVYKTLKVHSRTEAVLQYLGR